MSHSTSEYSVPKSTMPPRQIVARITEHHEVAPAHYKMKLRAGAVAATAQAGQFVHILPRPCATRDPLLRRAFSIMAASIDTIEVTYRVMGLGTSWLSHLRIGDEVDLIGPLGKPFEPLPAQAILVGGGVGVPPLVMLASTGTIREATNTIPQLAQPVVNPHLTAIIGARSQRDLIGIQELAAMGVGIEISTDDGSAGHHGRVTDLLEARLKTHVGTQPTVYSCGPLAMLRAVAGLCRQYQVPCQVSLEENMPCGVGICNGCVVPVTNSGDDYGRYRRICVDGPVVWAHEIDWEHLSASATCY